MKFYTVINCMDGRVQLPVIKYLQKRFNVEYVDSITEAGPNLVLSEHKNYILLGDRWIPVGKINYSTGNIEAFIISNNIKEKVIFSDSEWARFDNN